MDRSYTAERKGKKQPDMTKRANEQLLGTMTIYMALLSRKYFENILKLSIFYPWAEEKRVHMV